MANCNAADDQAVWLQTRAREDDIIHQQSWCDCVAANAKLKKEILVIILYRDTLTTVSASVTLHALSGTVLTKGSTSRSSRELME